MKSARLMYINIIKCVREGGVAEVIGRAINDLKKKKKQVKHEVFLFEQKYNNNIRIWPRKI